MSDVDKDDANKDKNNSILKELEEFAKTEAKSFIVILGSFLTILTFLIYIRKIGYIPLIFTILILLVIFQAFWIYKLLKRLTQDEDLTDHDNDQKPIESPDENFFRQLSLSFFLSPDEETVEKNLYIDTLKETFILNNRDCEMEYELTGYNTSSKSIKSHTVKIADDVPIKLEELNFRAYHNGNEVPWEITSDNKYHKQIRIDFESPLCPGEEFNLTYKCYFIGSFGPGREYVFFPVHKYKKGIGKIIGNIHLNSRPQSYNAMVEADDRLSFEPSEQQPDLIEDDDSWILKYEKNNPHSINILQFVRKEEI